MPSIKGVRDLRHFDSEVTGQGLAESIVPAQAISEIKQHSQKGAFDLFGPHIGSDVSSGSKDAANG